MLYPDDAVFDMAIREARLRTAYRLGYPRREEVYTNPELPIPFTNPNTRFIYRAVYHPTVRELFAALMVLSWEEANDRIPQWRTCRIGDPEFLIVDDSGEETELHLFPIPDWDFELRVEHLDVEPEPTADTDTLWPAQARFLDWATLYGAAHILWERSDRSSPQWVAERDRYLALWERELDRIANRVSRPMHAQRNPFIKRWFSYG